MIVMNAKAGSNEHSEILIVLSEKSNAAFEA